MAHDWYDFRGMGVKIIANFRRVLMKDLVAKENDLVCLDNHMVWDASETLNY